MADTNSGSESQAKRAPEDESPTPKTVAERLNEHGYPFQYSVLGRVIARFQPDSGSPWAFVASELPVSANDVDARIDFVLKHHSDSRFVVAECKRANPAYSDWCFFPAPHVIPSDRGPVDSVMAQRWVHMAGGGYSFGIIAGSVPIAYQIALPLRRGLRGDSGGQPKKDIDDALVQLARGTTGLLKMFRDSPTVLGGRQGADIFQVLFTTARLFVSDASLDQADLTTGNIDERNVQLREAPWLAYQYHTSVSVQYAGYTPFGPTSLDRLLTDEAVRTVFVVNSSAIDDFLIALDAFRVP